jgi:hypothetical protein
LKERGLDVAHRRVNLQLLGQRDHDHQPDTITDDLRSLFTILDDYTTPPRGVVNIPTRPKQRPLSRSKASSPRGTLPEEEGGDLIQDSPNGNTASTISARSLCAYAPVHRATRTSTTDERVDGIAKSLEHLECLILVVNIKESILRGSVRSSRTACSSAGHMLTDIDKRRRDCWILFRCFVPLTEASMTN